MAALQEKLTKEDGKEVVCWSNGNVFRSVTLLAVTWCEMQDDCDAFDPARALTKENLASFMGMLEFGKVSEGGWIDLLGYHSTIQLGVERDEVMTLSLLLMMLPISLSTT